MFKSSKEKEHFKEKELGIMNDSTCLFMAFESRALAFVCMHGNMESITYTEELSRPPGDADSGLLLASSSPPLTDD